MTVNDHKRTLFDPVDPNVRRGDVDRLTRSNELARRLRRAEDRLAAWKAEAEACREYDTMKLEPDEDLEHWSARSDIARIKIKKARAATDAIEKGNAHE